MQKCRLCQLREIDLVWNLGPSPYGDNFRPSRSEAIIESLHNFALGICKSCNLLQLCHETNLNEQYHQYLYLTKNTNNLIMYYSQLHKDLVQKFEINTDDLVIDIGGNDGSFLETFLTNGFTNLISIDPSIPAKKVSQDKGIKVLDEFFSKDAVEKIMNQNKVPKLISINYTLANVSNLQEFFENILKIMDSKTIISIVTGYHPDQFAINMFDYIGHDHLTYFTLSNFKLIAEKFNLKVLSFSKVEQKGGSINILMAQSNSDFVADSSIFQNLQREYFLDINSDNYFLELRKKVDLLKHKIQLILSEKFVGMPIVGLGASISTTYLMNYFELGNKISFLLDDDVNKIGRFAPRFGLEVKNLSEIKNYDVDVLVLLAWQHTNKLKERLKMLKFEGNLVIPLPRIQLELFS